MRVSEPYKKAYLSLQNLVLAIGWFYVECVLIKRLVLSQSLSSLELTDNEAKQITQAVYFLQLFCLLDFVNVLFSLTRSPFFAVFAQHFGRNHLLFSAIYCLPRLWIQNPDIGILFLFWGSIEIVRFPYYLLSIWGQPPFWMGYLRYTVFIPVYPIGFFYEVKLWIQSLPLIKEEDLHCVRLPNRWNFGFDYSMFVWIYLIIAIPSWVNNYSYMFTQRKSFFSKSGKTPPRPSVQ